MKSLSGGSDEPQKTDVFFLRLFVVSIQSAHIDCAEIYIPKSFVARCENRCDDVAESLIDGVAREPQRIV